MKRSSGTVICHIITGLETGGAERMLHKLVSSMDRASFRTVVISLRTRGTMAERLEAAGASVHTVGFSSVRNAILRTGALLRVIRQSRPDVIHGWMYHGNLAATFARACGATRAPLLWNVRASIDEFETMKRGTIAAIRTGAPLSRMPKRIVYNSRTSARQHEDVGFAADRTLVIPNGFDCQIFAPDEAAPRRIRNLLGIPPDALVVGQVARFDPMKNQQGLLRAFAPLTQTYSNLHLVMVGRAVDNANSTLLSLIKQLGLVNRVHLLGERQDLESLVPGLDLFVSSSACLEGFPNAVGEAMACGVPCVVTAVGDSGWLLGEAGRVVPPRDDSALTAAIAGLLALRPEERTTLGRVGRRRIESNFSLHAVTHSYESLYASASEQCACH